MSFCFVKNKTVCYNVVMKKIIAIIGTTASGKSDLGIYLAQKLNGEVVSCDSRQVFKGLDLGSGKVSQEEQKMAVHHMLDVVEPGKTYSVAEFQKEAYKKIDDILSRGKLPILVGGTGLYVRSITDGYVFSEVAPNESVRKQLSSNTREELIEKLVSLGEDKNKISGLSPAHLVRRIEVKLSSEQKKPNSPKYQVLKIGLTFPREELKKRIGQRIDVRLEQGMLDEVQGLLDNGVSPDFLDNLGLEYRYISRYLLGKISRDEFYKSLWKDTNSFAKRQMTWFKADKPIWLCPNDPSWQQQALKLAQDFLKQSRY